MPNRDIIRSMSGKFPPSGRHLLLFQNLDSFGRLFPEHVDTAYDFCLPDKVIGTGTDR